MQLLTLVLPGATLVDDGTLEGHTLGNIWHVSRSRDGSRIASCNNVEVVIWDAATRKKIVSIPVEASAGVMTVALSTDGPRVAVPLDKRIAWFDTTTGAHHPRAAAVGRTSVEFGQVGHEGPGAMRGAASARRERAR